MEGEAAANPYFFAYVSGILGSCGFMILVLYNLIGLIGFLREDTTEKASGLSKAAWAIGFLSFMFGPCTWFAAALALILARIERGRIYQEKSPLASATPCRMANINGAINLVIWLVITGGMIGTWMQM